MRRCGTSSGGGAIESTDSASFEAASDAPSGDAWTGDAPSCSADGQVSCCCEGDIQGPPVCSAGTLSCPSGYGLYFGSDCSCSGAGGPCCPGVNTLDASDAAASEGGADAPEQ